MAEHNELGAKGEELAEQFLRNKQYQIISRNYRFKHLEIDLVAQEGNTLVVVEVKTRTSSYLAGPEITVGRAKQRKLIRAANHFLDEFDLSMEVRFDIVSIILNKNECTIEHIADAFYPLI